MHQIDLILTITGGIAAAALLGYIALRLQISPLVGAHAPGRGDPRGD